MTTQTLTLTDFLLARIAEEVSRVDTIPDWYCTDSARGEGWGSRGDCDLCGKYMFDGTESVTGDAFWEHMEDTHRRAFRLAECEAKRLIVERYRYLTTDPDTPQRSWAYALRAIALPYATHPDYREEWRP